MASSFWCSSDQPIWDGIDFIPCVRDRYLSFLLPLVLVGGSLSIAVVSRLVQLSTSSAPIQLPTTSGPTASAEAGAAASPVALESEVLHVGARAVYGSEPEEGKSAVEVMRDVGMLVLLVVLLGVELWRSLGSPADVLTGWGGVALSAFLVALSAFTSLDRIGIGLFGFRTNQLEAHRSTLFIVYGFVSFVNLRSSVLASSPTLLADSLAAGVVLALVLLDVCTPYRAVLDGALEGHRARGAAFHLARQARSPEGGSTTKKTPPGLEEPRSLFARATFTYMNPLIFRHFNRPITDKEIPDLREDDRSAVVVAGWRLYREQLLKGLSEEERAGIYVRGSLSWALFKYFKGYFALQAFWAATFVLCSFIAPLTLKLILEFIAYRKLSLADPDAYPPQPMHLAVTYLLAMFFGQILASVSHGYALWLGRRICIRLRAIIVAEVFTAALRRTDSAKVAKAFDNAAKQVAEDPLGAAETKGADEKAAEPEADANEGKILNLISVDAFSISEISAYLLYLMPECPMSIILSITFLYRLLGASAAVGVMTLLAILPVQTWLAGWFVKIQNKLLVATDARMNLVTEVLGAIRLVKFNAWEGRFGQRMSEKRAQELRLLRTRCIAWTLQGLATSFAPAAVTCVTFAFHTKVFAQPLETETAFTALALFSMLRSPLEATTDMVAHSLSAHVSTNRVQAFLSQTETKKYKNLTTDSEEIGFRNATLTHSSSTAADAEEGFSLKDLNFIFPKGELSLVAGPVGSGKTTLLMSLLGETSLVKGQILMHEHYSRDSAPLDEHGLSQTVAFCAQQPWLVGASIKENIIFGSAWDERRYLATLKACQLERDLEIFELGDETEVGEKGTACSGGQKARISLARALYSRSTTLILDDILSAVDASTASFLFKNCLKGPLMSGRTVILVTHAVGLCLPGAAFAVVLDNGSVVASGPPAELRANQVFNEDELADNAEDDAHHVTEGHEPNDEGVVEVAIEQQLSNGDAAADEARKLQDAAKRESKRLVKDETSASGGVDMAVYRLYLGAAGSVFFWIGLTAVFLGSQGLQIEVNLWIRKWAANYDPRVESATLLSLVLAPVAQTLLALGPSDNQTASASAFSFPTSRADTTTFYLTWYVVLSAIYIGSIAVRMGWLFFGSLRASADLYDQLTRRVLGARIRFFDSTPSGRILNRFSKDIANIDQEAAPVFMYLVSSILGCIAVVVVISVATPLFIFGAAFIVCLYWLIGAAYLALSRELKRIESVSRSPIFVCFGEALTGMVSIRAYGETARFTEQMLEKSDDNTRPFLLLWASNRWLSICCDCSGSLVALFAGTFVLLNPALDAGVAGLSLSYAITFTDFVLWVVRLYSALEISMGNSVERVREYLLLEAEEEESAKGIEPPAAWPSTDGTIEVRNLQATYAPELDPVLKDVSFTVLPHERVGICGRTGSGKSTLALTFFRFLEASAGQIIIDGLDISKVSLQTLRSRLTIIPQESILFEGTIRDNLDPFNLASSDHEIWEALVNVRMAHWSTPSASASRAASRAGSTADLVQLASQADEEDEGEQLSQITSLDQSVAAGGKNFSSGERQLLALARGLLKLRSGGSNILLLDESTANLDHASDAAIQKTLSTSLAGVSMLIIAHRLKTIIDADKVLMLDAGRVLEYDAPLVLLQKEGGSFRDLCERSGEYATLLELAQNAHDARQAAKL